MLLRALERVVDLMAMVEELPRTMLGVKLSPEQTTKVREIKTECANMYPGGIWTQTGQSDRVVWNLASTTGANVATITITAQKIAYWNKQKGNTPIDTTF